MPEPKVLDRALALAKQQPVLGFNPFRRGSDLTAYDREGLLASTLDAYNGRRFKFFQAMPGEQIANAETGEGSERPGRIDVNNLRSWIDTLSNTYGSDVQRTFRRDGKRVEPKDDPIIEAVVERYNDAEINRVMEDVDAGLNLLGNQTLRPIFDEAHGELVIHRYNAPMVRVIQNPINARWPEATILLGIERDDEGNEHTRAEVWTADRFVELYDTKPIKDERLEGPSPLVHCFNRVPSNLSRYWCPCVGPALAHIDMVLNNDLLGPLGYTGVMQGFAQAVVHGLDPSGKVTIGPGRVMQFSGNPDIRQDFEFKQPQAPITDVLELIRLMISMVNKAHGIPEGLFDVKTDATGAAIVQAAAPLAEMREKRSKVFKRPERDLLRATIRALAGRDKRVPLGTDADIYDVSVRYGKAATSQSVDDRNKREQFLIDLGVLTPGDIAVQEFPDRWDDAEDANEEIAERKAAKQEEDNAQMETELKMQADNAPQKPAPFGAKK